MPFRIGPTELIIILVLVLIIFGVGRLPQVGGAIGRGIREFRRGQKGDFDDDTKPAEKETEAEKK
jgi:sec-independent protein translocase protein TatA